MALLVSCIPILNFPHKSCLIQYFDHYGNKLSFCSGTLLSRDRIKTAAHCGSIADQKSAGQYTILISCPNGEGRIAISRQVHPNSVWGDWPLKHDIATLQVEEPFNITPMKYVKSEEEVNEFLKNAECAIFGYGRNAQGYGGILLGAKAKFSKNVPQPIIKAQKENMVNIVVLKPSSQVGGGDSGGGLHCRNNNGEWVNVGTITSIVDFKGIAKLFYGSPYSIIEKLTPNLDWLNSVISN